MKWFFAFLPVFFLSYSAYGENAPKVITVAADLWCPINCQPGDAKPGIGIELATHIFEPAGYHINYIIMPWKRALEEVKSGKIDAVMGASRTDDATLIFPKHSIYELTDDFYVQAQSTWKYAGINSLKGQRLGTIKGYGYHETVMSYIAANKYIPGAVQEVGGDKALEQNIKKLLAGRIDILIESKLVVEYASRNMKLDSDIKHVGSIRQGNVYMAFSPALNESSHLAKLYDEGIGKLKLIDTITPLYAAYGLTEIP